jgi:predicted nucleic acid-binding protein
MSPRFVRSEAVIDTSCLQCLMMLERSFPRYNLLRALSLRYYSIHIPQHVWNEIVRHGRRRRQLQQLLKTHPFFIRCNVGDPYTARLLFDKQRNPNAKIDRGEAEAIIQARERGISDVLIDEKQGRKIAEAHTLNPKGVIGLICEFKQSEIVPEARPLFVKCKHMGFRLKDALVNETLHLLGEEPLPKK